MCWLLLITGTHLDIAHVVITLSGYVNYRLFALFLKSRWLASLSLHIPPEVLVSSHWPYNENLSTVQEHTMTPNMPIPESHMLYSAWGFLILGCFLDSTLLVCTYTFSTFFTLVEKCRQVCSTPGSVHRFTIYVWSLFHHAKWIYYINDKELILYK